MQNSVRVLVIITTAITNRIRFTYFQILCHGTASSIGEFPGGWVTDPRVYTTSSRVEPRNVRKAKVLSQSLIQHGHRHFHESPADGTDLGGGASTGAHTVVVRQVQIEDEFTLDRGDVGDAVFVPGRVRKDGANVNLDRAALANRLRELVLRSETLVTDVNFFAGHGLDRHGELAARKGGGAAVTEPLVQQFKGKETFVVHLQQFGRED